MPGFTAIYYMPFIIYDFSDAAAMNILVFKLLNIKRIGKQSNAALSDLKTLSVKCVSKSLYCAVGLFYAVYIDAVTFCQQGHLHCKPTTGALHMDTFHFL